MTPFDLLLYIFGYGLCPSIFTQNGVMITFSATEILRFYHIASLLQNASSHPLGEFLWDFDPLNCDVIVLTAVRYAVYTVYAETRVLS